MVKSKGGFIRVIEATIAILIVLGAILVVSMQRETREYDDVNVLPFLLDEIAQDISLREKIVNSDPNAVNDISSFLEANINPSLSFEVRICDLVDDCLPSLAVNAEGNVFAAERVISTTIDNPGFNPKKIRVFVWRE